MGMEKKKSECANKCSNLEAKKPQARTSESFRQSQIKFQEPGRNSQSFQAQMFPKTIIRKICLGVRRLFWDRQLFSILWFLILKISHSFQPRETWRLWRSFWNIRARNMSSAWPGRECTFTEDCLMLIYPRWMELHRRTPPIETISGVGSPGMVPCGGVVLSRDQVLFWAP